MWPRTYMQWIKTMNNLFAFLEIIIQNIENMGECRVITSNNCLKMQAVAGTSLDARNGHSRYVLFQEHAGDFVLSDIYIFIHSVDVLSKRFWTGAIRSYISVSLWWEEPYIFVPDSFTYHTVMVTSRQLSRRFDKLGDGDGLRCLCPFWRLGCFLSQYPLTHLNEHLWQCAPTCSWTSKNV